MKFRFPTGGMLIAGVGIVTAVLVLWLLFADQGNAEASTAAQNNGPASTSAQTAAQAGVVLAQRSAGYKPFAPGASPYLLSAGPLERGLDIDQLKRDLAGSGKDLEEELDRLVKLARFRDRMNVLAEVLPSLSDEERRQESYEVLHQLPEHVAKGEILPREALVTTTALLQIGESDPVVRDELTKRLTASLQAHARQLVGPEPITESRFQSYAQERDRMVSEVQSSVADPEARQAAMAQREFEIRQRHY
ncbi:hypothetical protein J2W28_002920 [Variovorax boronicumulans]|uniref:hypothetical protein n=1 Tax=Variovorax boronicumulans TaxID=436515 RepID=UPI0027845286|nr:hypothetical protein [Variovorax boronicumulans]MDP9991743.1 hypothetical protein [Variovorax boronicumulans]MDQ0003771.1 hypothetical protein [Variovorax boronicumulans]MDQ0070287.1 hypothetical protein [Variovorax boronicumulans]